MPWIEYIVFQVERNLQDAMQVARNVLIDPYLLPGGGAAEMALAHVRLFLSKFCSQCFVYRF